MGCPWSSDHGISSCTIKVHVHKSCQIPDCPLLSFTKAEYIRQWIDQYRPVRFLDDVSFAWTSQRNSHDLAMLELKIRHIEFDRVLRLREPTDCCSPVTGQCCISKLSVLCDDQWMPTIDTVDEVTRHAVFALYVARCQFAIAIYEDVKFVSDDFYDRMLLRYAMLRNESREYSTVVAVEKHDNVIIFKSHDIPFLLEWMSIRVMLTTYLKRVCVVSCVK